MIKKVAFTMYPVTNMDRALKFYEEMFSLKPSAVYGDDKAWVEYDLPMGGCFALTTMATGVTPSADAGGSIAFEVEDLHGLIKSLKAKNAQFKMDVMDTPVCQMCVILDSEGNAVTLHKLKR